MDTEKLIRIFKALSNQNRLDIYLRISENQKSYGIDDGCLICDIKDSFNIGSPTISHHLKELSDADLIYTKKDGKYLIAKINKEIIEEIIDFLRSQE